MSTWVFGAERWVNLIYYSLGGHKDIIVGCFFEKDSLDVSTTQLFFFLILKDWLVFFGQTCNITNNSQFKIL